MDFLKNTGIKYLLLALILLIAVFGVGVLKENGLQILEIKNPEKNNQQGIEEIKPINVLFVGDIMLDRKVEAQMEKDGFDYPFEKIKELLNKNDFVFGNLEGPISENPKKFSLTSMYFSFDAKIIEPLLAANFRILSLANNHTLNTGKEDFNETQELLKKAGIDYVGDPMICSEKYIVEGNLLFLGFNKTFSECKDEKIIEIIEKTGKENPGKFLIISIHWGEEYKTESSQAQKDLAHKIIDSGADLIVGHHPHVVQDVEQYKNKMIFYSLGNFIFDQYFSEETQEGLAIRLEIYGSKIIYRIFPIESIVSQPQLMEKEKAKEFMKEHGFESIVVIKDAEIKNACFGKNCFYAETIEKPEDLALGLMFRKNLDQDRGMLFVFPEFKNYAFWMKNTLIALDIIWLNENMEVVYIAENVRPCEDKICKSINPIEKSKYVLELNAGTAQKINLKIGDKLTF